MFLIVLATLFSLPFELAQTLPDEGLVRTYSGAAMAQAN